MNSLNPCIRPGLLQRVDKFRSHLIANMKNIPYSIRISAATILLWTIGHSEGRAQPTPYQMSVPVSATIQETPPQITLNWLPDDSALSYTVYRRNPAGDWDLKQNVKKLLQFVDVDVQPGVGYEYRVSKAERLGAAQSTGYGYLYTGIDLPAREFSGTVELIVDDTFAKDLTTELARWQSDLVADGWKVIRHDVKRSDSVQFVKSIIANDVNQDTTIRSLFLFGHVPVPFSGFLNPDGHPNHYGAWPADMYYGDFITNYTDEVSDAASLGSRPENVNIPGDGKFDPTYPDFGVSLEIGRVDLSNMTDFTTSEKELLRKYLNKDHAFRAGTLTAPSRAYLSDNFGNYGGGFAATAWRNFPNLVGLNNIQTDGTWFTKLDTGTYLWAYGCGGGTDNSAGGIGATTDFATTDTKAIFTMLFGSYFGDWDVENNFLRAPLTSSMALTSCWSGRPFWYVHHMAMGETIGFATKLTQNNTNDDYDAGYAAGGVHIALMGDPTLRMTYPHPPSDFVSVQAVSIDNNKAVRIDWKTATPADGYNIYRANHWNDSYEKLNNVPVTALTYTDLAPFADTDHYAIRAVAKAGNTHGTFYTAGQSSNDVVTSGLLDVASNPSLPLASTLLLNLDGPLLNITVNYRSNGAGQLALYDLMGRELMRMDKEISGAGMHNFTVDTRAISGEALSGGVYFVRLLSQEAQITTKFVMPR